MPSPHAEADDPPDPGENRPKPLFDAPRFFNPAPNVIIVYNNHPWMVHDGTLAKHSKYFDKMFRNDWKEAGERRVTMEALDCEDWMFEQCLRFCYIGRLKFNRIPDDANWAAKYIEMSSVAVYLQAESLLQHIEKHLREFCNDMITNLSRVRRIRSPKHGKVWNKYEWAPYYPGLVDDVRTEFCAAVRHLYEREPGVDFLPEMKRNLFALLSAAGPRFMTAAQTLELGDEVPEFQRDLLHAMLTGEPAEPSRPDKVTYRIMGYDFHNTRLTKGLETCKCGNNLLEIAETFVVNLLEEAKPSHFGNPNRWCEVCVGEGQLPDWCEMD